MPSGPRIRTDSVFGTLTDNPLLVGATTMNSAGLANLSAVASAHAVIILDPLRTAGAPEIVIVTAHTGAATAATITRGAYGTAARQHASGVLWIHAPTIEDTIRIVTSGTRPSDPYQGQLIYETDTDSYVGRGAGSVWQTVLGLGAWTAYTPTISQPGAVTKTVTWSRWSRVGRRIRFQGDVNITGTGTAGQVVTVSLPVPAAQGALNTGVGLLYDNSAAAAYTAITEIEGTTALKFRPTIATANAFLGTGTFTAALAGGDILRWGLDYEAAS